MFSTIIIIVMSVWFLVEVLFVYHKNKKYDNPPDDEEYEIYSNLTNGLLNNTLTLATLTIAILVLFMVQGSYAGTQTLLIYGLSLLFFSAFLDELSGFKKIVLFIQRRALLYWFYSMIFSILTLYVSPSLSYKPSFQGIIVILLIVFSLVFILHTYLFYVELKISKK